MPTAIAEKNYFLYPLKEGCGVKFRAETVVHEARAFINEHGHVPFFILTSANAENAFSKTSKVEMLRQTEGLFPSLIGLVNALYAKREPHLCLGDELIWSREGTQQGDPAICLVFALEI